MKLLTVIIAFIIGLLMLATGCVTITPVCRHIVLSQYAAAIDAGYEARYVTFLNPPEVRKKTGYKYHVAVEVKEGDMWGNWVPQPKTSWTTTRQQPTGIILRQGN